MSLLYLITTNHKDARKKVRKTHAPIEQVQREKVEYNRARSKQEWKKEYMML